MWNQAASSGYSQELPFQILLTTFITITQNLLCMPSPCTMHDLPRQRVFKAFNQDFAVNENYSVTKELGQGV